MKALYICVCVCGFCSVNGLCFSDNYQLKIHFQEKIFNARTGGLMMLTNQHNIYQVSYNEGNFQAVCLYCRRVLHTFSLNNTFSMWHLLIQVPLLSILPHIMVSNFEGGEKVCIFEDHVSGTGIFWEKHSCSLFPWTYRAKLWRN